MDAYNAHTIDVLIYTMMMVIHYAYLYILVFTNNDTIYNFADFLWSKFTDVNEVTHNNTHLGIGNIKLSQPRYIRKIVKYCNLESNISFSNNPYEITSNSLLNLTPYDISKYRLIKSLFNHAAIHTRPGILYITSELARKLTNLTLHDCQAALRVVQQNCMHT